MNIRTCLSKKNLFFISGFLSLFSVNGQIPENYYEKANGLTNGELKTALHQIIRVGERLGYGSGSGKTWSGFEKTDLHPEGYVWDMYSANKRYFPGNAKVPSGMNIEHSVAKSWWGGDNNNAYKDLYHLNPSDANANSARSNYPLGIVENGKTVGTLKIGNNTFGNEYNSDSFEPLDEYKGDFARAYMYMFTCYEDLSWTGTKAPSMVKNEKYPMLRPWAAQLLLKWNREDPVSEKELNRAAEIFKIQKNRNPFIDYPEIAEHLWGEKQGIPFFFTPNTDPIIISPANNTTLNFEPVHYESNATIKITIKALNLTSDLKLNLLGEDANLFELSVPTISPEQALNGMELSITFHPVKAVTSKATLSINGEGLKERTLYLTATATEEFQALTPEDITPTSFDAVWTSSSLTNRFLVEVYNKTEIVSGNVLIEDASFASNLDGWNSSGTTYQDDKEKKGVRIATSSKSGDLISPLLNLEIGGKLIFSSKKWASDTQVEVTIKQDQKIIATIALSDNYESYEVPLLPASNTSKISFHAMANKRLFISEAQVYSGGMRIEETTLNDFPKWVENVTRLQIKDLQPDSTYYYRITPDLPDAQASEEIRVHTMIATSIEQADINKIKVFAVGNQIHIESDKKEMDVKIFNLSGRLVGNYSFHGSNKYIEMSHGGVYCIHIITGNSIIRHKLLIP